MPERIGVGSHSYGPDGTPTCSIESTTVPEQGREGTVTNPVYHRPAPDRAMLSLLLRCNSHLGRFCELLATSSPAAHAERRGLSADEIAVRTDRFRLAGAITRLAISLGIEADEYAAIMEEARPRNVALDS
jgi:hypothetical protein